jgi:hypothetical protein
MIALIVVLWWIIGYAGFIYWYIKDHDLTLSWTLAGLFYGLAGVFSWLVCWGIYRYEHPELGKIVIIKKRR